MRNSKLYSILQALNKIEQNQLRKYLHSPYFNVNETIISLFEYLTEHINESNDDSELEKKRIWRVICPGEKYNDVRFRKYCSDLLKLIEGFLVQQVFEDNELQRHLFLIEAVGRRKLVKFYNSAVRKASRVIEKSPYRSAQRFFNQYQYERSYFNLHEFETKRDEKSNLEEIIRNLDIFYISEKLRLYCSALSRQRILSSMKYEVAFIEELLDYLAKNPDYFQYPSIAIYYQIQLIYTAPDDESHYFKLKDLLGKYSLLFPMREAQEELYIPPINYCIRKANQGNQNFLEELFHLYRELIEKGIFTSGGQLSPWHFRNIVFVGLRLKQFDWTESFILNYKEYLPESFRDNAVTFNLARLYWYQKKHDKVIEQLREVEYEDVTYNLGSKSMLLATYYETDEIEALYSLLDSFRVYLNRRKDIPERGRKNYKNLIKFTKKLTRINPRDKKSLEKLKKEIEGTKDFVDRKWLMEKIVELEG